MSEAQIQPSDSGAPTFRLDATTHGDTGVRAVSLGPVKVKGRSEAVEVFAISHPLS